MLISKCLPRLFNLHALAWLSSILYVTARRWIDPEMYGRLSPGPGAVWGAAAADTRAPKAAVGGHSLGRQRRSCHCPCPPRRGRCPPSYGSRGRKRGHRDGHRDIPLHCAAHGGAVTGVTGVTRPAMRSWKSNLSHCLDVKAHYAQSPEERHYLLLIYGAVSRGSRKCT